MLSVVPRQNKKQSVSRGKCKRGKGELWREKGGKGRGGVGKITAESTTWLGVSNAMFL